MIAAASCYSSICDSLPEFGSPESYSSAGFSNLCSFNCKVKCSGILKVEARSDFSSPIKAIEASRTSYLDRTPKCGGLDSDGHVVSDCSNGFSGGNHDRSVNRTPKNVVWHKCSVQKIDRQELLKQKGCVLWITGLSGSGKSTLACALSRALHMRGKLTYILDGDNVRHGLNKDLTFKSEDRVENIRRIGEVAKLFADAGIISIASLISPYRKDRDACRALLQGDFIEVYMDIPLQVCEARDPKGLYKLVRAGKIKGFTGVDDPYESPLKSEIVLQQKGNTCPSPSDMADTVISYLDSKGYLQA